MTRSWEGPAVRIRNSLSLHDTRHGYRSSYKQKQQQQRARRTTGLFRLFPCLGAPCARQAVVPTAVLRRERAQGLHTTALSALSEESQLSL